MINLWPKKADRHAYLIYLRHAPGGTEPGYANIYMAGGDSPGKDQDDQELLFDLKSSRTFGYRMTPEHGDGPVLQAICLDENLDGVKPLYPSSRSGALVTNQAKEIIESFDIPKIEFFPVDVVRGQEFDMSSLSANRPQSKPEWLGKKNR